MPTQQFFSHIMGRTS